MKRLKQALLFCFASIATSKAANANCLNASSNERLINYCLVQRASKQLIDLRTAQIIDYRLKHEGYEQGLGLPGRTKQLSFQPYVTPILDYETDINGGNPNKPLQLGSITFTGDPNLVRKEGIVAGAGAGAYGRYLVGEGRYIDYGFGASYAHSFEHDIGIQRRFANVCSKNHISNWWYIDGCAGSSYVEKELTEDTRNTLSLTTSKLFTLDANSHHQASFGVNRVYDEDYEQNQLTLGFQTIHRNGWHSSINAVFGESIDGEIATREAISASLSLPVRKRRFTASASYSEADGAKLLGVARADETWSLSASYNVYKNIDVGLGYTETDSTIDYFDVSTPTVSLSFKPIRF
jgi:hypothetical protein